MKPPSAVSALRKKAPRWIAGLKPRDGKLLQNHPLAMGRSRGFAAADTLDSVNAFCSVAAGDARALDLAIHIF